MRVVQELERATLLLREGVSCKLIPEDGMEIGYAIPHAKNVDDVCITVIHIEKHGLSIRSPAFSSCPSSRVVSSILTALRFSPDLRCACSIRYSETLRTITDDMMLEACTIDAEKIPPGLSTMDWAVVFCTKEQSALPDLLFIQKAHEHTYEARLFGESPGSIATNLLKISQRISDATL